MTATWMAHLPAPDPLPQPAPTGMLWLLLILTFFLHLLPMNLVLGGSIVSLVARWRGRRGRDPHAIELARVSARATPTLVAATVSLGVAALLFVQVLYGRALFAGSVLMAWPWISVVALLILAYYGTYRLAALAGDGASGLSLATVVSLFFVTIAFVYVNNMSLMLRVGEFAAMTRGGTSGWRLNLDDASFAPRLLHMLLGALAVAGAATAWLGHARRATDAAFARWAMRYGSGWVAIATFVNLFAGSWWLMVLPRDVLLRFAGRDAVATSVLMLGIAAGLVALMAFALASRATDPGPPVRVGLWALGATLPVMVFTRDQVRESAFVVAGLDEAMRVAPQWGPIALFFALFAVALAAIVWMVSVYVGGTQRT